MLEIVKWKRKIREKNYVKRTLYEKGDMWTTNPNTLNIWSLTESSATLALVHYLVACNYFHGDLESYKYFTIKYK